MTGLKGRLGSGIYQFKPSKLLPSGELHIDVGKNDGKLDEPGSENVGEEEGETPVVIQPPNVDGAFPLHILNNHNELKVDNNNKAICNPKVCIRDRDPVRT